MIETISEAILGTVLLIGGYALGRLTGKLDCYRRETLEMNKSLDNLAERIVEAKDLDKRNNHPRTMVQDSATGATWSVKDTAE